MFSFALLYKVVYHLDLDLKIDITVTFNSIIVCLQTARHIIQRFFFSDFLFSDIWTRL